MSATLERVALGLLLAELALLLGTYLLPSPDPAALPGRAPRAVVAG